MKKLAVLLPTYNASPYIKSSIDSLLDQTFSDFDIYIYDDFSTDDTSEIIDSYNHPRIFYRKNESNLGIAKTLNKGLEELLFHYEYIARARAEKTGTSDPVPEYRLEIDYQTYTETDVLEREIIYSYGYEQDLNETLDRYEAATKDEEDLMWLTAITSINITHGLLIYFHRHASPSFLAFLGNQVFLTQIL